MERTLRVSLNTCPLHTNFGKKNSKTFNTKSIKNSTNQHNTHEPTRTCHVELFKSQFFLSLIPFRFPSLSDSLSLKLSFLPNPNHNPFVPPFSPFPLLIFTILATVSLIRNF